MNYFYTYVEDEQEVSSLQQIQTEMQRKNAAVCFFDYGSTAQWEQLQAVWKQSDILYIQDIAHLASEVQELKHRLSTLQKSGVCVRPVSYTHLLQSATQQSLLRRIGKWIFQDWRSA